MLMLIFITPSLYVHGGVALPGRVQYRQSKERSISEPIHVVWVRRVSQSKFVNFGPRQCSLVHVFERAQAKVFRTAPERTIANGNIYLGPRSIMMTGVFYSLGWKEEGGACRVFGGCGDRTCPLTSLDSYHTKLSSGLGLRQSRYRLNQS